MNPALSVIFLTTLIGVGQGLFLALFTQQSYALFDLLPQQDARFYGWGSLLALVFTMAGLIASFFTWAARRVLGARRLSGALHGFPARSSSCPRSWEYCFFMRCLT